MRLHWQPCRVCGNQHQNPRSSSICPPCGAIEAAHNEAERAREQREFDESPFGRFMDLPEDERWRLVFDMLMNNATEE